MSAGGSADHPLAPELLSVAEAARARLRAETKEDHEAARAAANVLREAATLAMSAGFPLTEIARAEALGKELLRGELGRDALSRVERSGLQVRETQAKHHRAIARAVRLGLSTREIAAAAGVTHGTVRAISDRLNGGTPDPEDAANG